MNVIWNYATWGKIITAREFHCQIIFWYHSMHYQHQNPKRPDRYGYLNNLLLRMPSYGHCLPCWASKCDQNRPGCLLFFLSTAPANCILANCGWRTFEENNFTSLVCWPKNRFCCLLLNPCYWEYGSVIALRR